MVARRTGFADKAAVLQRRFYGVRRHHLFNANPLLKFDGYYMLSDILEVPNLYDRARRYLQWLVQRYVYGMTNAQPVSTRFREQILLVVYGICSQIYKVLVLFGIVLFVIGKLYIVGRVLAAWSAISWLVVPVGKFIHWLATSPSLHEHRARAILTTTLFLAVVLGGIGVIPMPDHNRTTGVVESSHRLDLAIQTDGFVQGSLCRRPANTLQPIRSSWCRTIPIYRPNANSC